jgi:coxsackievirus/adenovirus receptor
MCDNELKEVCGSNGITYANQCRLRLDACRTRTLIFAKYEGPCGEHVGACTMHGMTDGCAGIVCDYYGVCVTDGRGNGECTCPQTDACMQSVDIDPDVQLPAGKGNQVSRRCD